MRSTILFCLLFLATQLLHAQPPGYVPTDGLIGWWPFNGSADDESGNGNNGVVHGAQLVSDRFGAVGHAFGFNGTDASIEIAHGPSLGLGSSISVSCWVNIPTHSPAIVRCAIGKQTLPHLSGLAIETNDNIGTPGTPQFFLSQGGTTLEFEDELSLELNTWVHLVGTYDGSVLRLFVNGLETGQSAGLLDLSSVTQNLFFGREGELGRYFEGDLDDIGIWGRALTAAEVQALHNASSAPCISTTPVSFTGLGADYSTSQTPASLVGSPTGGVFIGPGISGSTFSPASAGEGTHSVIYTYVDADGCVNSAGMCTTVSVGMGQEPGGSVTGALRIHPNPNNGRFTVQVELTGPVSLQVFEAIGRSVYSETFHANGEQTLRELDLSSLASGTYTVQVENKGQRMGQRVVVE